MIIIKHRSTGAVLYTAESATTLCEAVEQAVSEDADLAFAYLPGVNLALAYLPDVNLAGAELTGANLTNSYLVRARLAGAHLTRADLIGANLTSANLTRADLTRADLAHAGLAGAHLEGADLAGADLTRADLAGANLSRAYLVGANLTRADLTGADLGYANLTGAYLEGAYLAGTNLEGAKLRDGHLEGKTIVPLPIPATDQDSKKNPNEHHQGNPMTNKPATKILIIEAYGALKKYLDGEGYVQNYLYLLSKRAGMTIFDGPHIKRVESDDGNGGLSASVMWKESGAMFHAWPDRNGYFRVVIDSCKDFDSQDLTQFTYSHFAVDESNQPGHLVIQVGT